MKKYIKCKKKHIKSIITNLNRCFINSLRSFSPEEMNYRLGIDKFNGFNLAYRIGTTDEEIIKDSFQNDIFFKLIPEYNILSNHTIIDVGAHIGTFSLLAASKLHKGLVFAVEASSESFNYLLINKILNDSNNLIIKHCALYDKEGVVILHHGRGNWGHSLTKKASYFASYEEVRSLTLAQFMDENKIMTCDLIRFNCEGAEFPILLSTPKRYLRRINHFLIFFHCDLIRDGNTTLKSLLAHFDSSGFDYRIEWKKKRSSISNTRGYIVAYKRKIQ